MNAMRPWLLDLLRCPSCGGTLRPEGDPGGAAHDPRLTCSCGAGYPVRNGVARFVQSDDYVGNFSFEWNLHRRTQFDAETGGASTRRFLNVTGILPEQLRDLTVLDAGVGSGRFADAVARAGARVVGLDLSYAVDAAQENLGGMENVSLVQGDLLAPPLCHESFDFIYSIGVLHHTPDAERAFRSLLPLLKPGGSIAIYVYPRYGIWWRFSDLYRRLTIRLPRRALYTLCYAAVPLFYLARIPVLGPLLRLLLPVSHHPDWRWRVLDTFDWYSCRYQSKHTYPEVQRWFRTAGLVDIELMDTPVCARGRKPAGRLGSES